MANITLGAGTIDQTRQILTVAIGGATDALTLTTPNITVTVNSVSAPTGTITKTGSGATAKLVIPLTSVAPVGKAIVVTATSSGIVDASEDTLSNGSVTVTDAQSAAQTVVQAAVQAGFVNDGFHQLFSNGLFGKVHAVSAGKYTVYAMDNLTPLADVYGSTDTAGNISIDHIDRR